MYQFITAIFKFLVMLSIVGANNCILASSALDGRNFGIDFYAHCGCSQRLRADNLSSWIIEVPLYIKHGGQC